MIGIVILNYNSWELTIDCVESILQSSNEDKDEIKIYIVDNQSTSPMPQLFKEMLKKSNIKYIVARENKGYSAGNNLGIKEAINDKCAYIMISNSDVIFHPHSISTLKKHLKNNRDVGIVGPKIYLPDNTIQDIDMLVKTTLNAKYKNIFKKTPFRYLIPKSYEFSKDKNNLTESFEVHSVSGCCFMMNSDAFEYLYPLDETPFLYEEEVIIGIKMEELGLKTMYVIEAEITHFHGKTTQDLKAFSYIEFVRSEIYYLREYMRNSSISITPLIFIRFMKYLVNCLKYKDYREYFFVFFTRGLEFYL